MSVQVYGINHIALEVDDIEKAIAFTRMFFNSRRWTTAKATHFSRLASTSFSRSLKSKKCGRTGRNISG